MEFQKIYQIIQSDYEKRKENKYTMGEVGRRAHL